LDGYVGVELCSKALTLIAATKINWFQTNDHKGQGAAVHFIQKAAQNFGQDFWDGGNITDLCKAMHRAGHWASTHLVLNIMNMHTGAHLSLLPTSMHDHAKGIVLTSDFEARALSMPAGTGPHSLIHATIKKFGHNMVVMANDLAQELIDAARIVEDILDNAKASRAKKAVDDRLKYHMGATFLTKKSRMTIGALAPIGALGCYLFNCQKSSTLTRSPLIRREVDGKMTKFYAMQRVTTRPTITSALRSTTPSLPMHRMPSRLCVAVPPLASWRLISSRSSLLSPWSWRRIGRLDAEMEAPYKAIKVASNKIDAAGASSSNACSAPGAAKE
jgi:hypothetical protein